MAEKFFKVPFANEGDRLAVPDVIQADGSVSFTQGYGFDYERDQATDPQAKDISRESFNSLLYDITSVLGDIQRTGVQPYMSEITYSKGSIVWFNEELYVSLSNSNTTDPTSDKWTILYDKTNTTVDKNNFIRAEGSKTTVVTDDIAHDENETSREKVASAELANKKISKENISQTTGSRTDYVMSEKAVTDISFGINQKWQDVTKERVAGVKYTNSRSKAIQIFIQKPSNTTQPTIVIQDEEFTLSAVNASVSMTLAIPPNAEYYLKNGQLATWKEIF